MTGNFIGPVGEHGPGDYFICSLDDGHTGNHEAHGTDGQFYDSWTDAEGTKREDAPQEYEYWVSGAWAE
jgi:hypothetical protein